MLKIIKGVFFCAKHIVKKTALQLSESKTTLCLIFLLSVILHPQPDLEQRPLQTLWTWKPFARKEAFSHCALIDVQQSAVREGFCLSNGFFCRDVMFQWSSKQYAAWGDIQNKRWTSHVCQADHLFFTYHKTHWILNTEHSVLWHTWER